MAVIKRRMPQVLLYEHSPQPSDVQCADSKSLCGSGARPVAAHYLGHLAESTFSF
jgi:hypothetical protein